MEFKIKFEARTDRVKCTDIHRGKSWLLAALYNGTVSVWNYDSGSLVKTINVSDKPVRAARFIERKNWIITGSDDCKVKRKSNKQ